MGTPRLVNTSIARNNIAGVSQGVIRNDVGGQLSLINTTYAKNTVSPFACSNSSLVNNGSTVAKNTIISENVGPAIVGNLPAVGSSNNLIGTNVVVLGNLVGNGGSTPTLAIAEGSAAHNTGTNAAVVTANFGTGPFSDQRSAPFVRINDTTVDIGAVDVQAVPEFFFANGFE